MLLSDNEMIKKIKEGETKVFEGFVEDYKDKAFSLTLKILRNNEEAEDSLQESFLKLYKAIIEEKFNEQSKLSTYFYTIVYNTAVDNYKKLKKKSFNMTSIDVNESSFKEGDELNFTSHEVLTLRTEKDDTGNRMTDSEIQSIVNKYVNEIPVQYSLILIMFFVDGLSHEEISSLLGLPVGTVKNRIFRAKDKVKELILSKIPESEILNYV